MEISGTVGMVTLFFKRNQHSSLLPNISEKHNGVRWREKSQRELIYADLKNAEYNVINCRKKALIRLAFGVESSNLLCDFSNSYLFFIYF